VAAGVEPLHLDAPVPVRVDLAVDGHPTRHRRSVRATSSTTSEQLPQATRCDPGALTNAAASPATPVAGRRDAATRATESFLLTAEG
jgi:hypothetical protein